MSRSLAVAGLLSLSLPAAAQLHLPADFGSPVSVGVTSLKEIRSRGTVLQQLDYSCGSAAIATLLTHHYRRPVSEQAVFRAMYEKGDQARIRREGFSLLDMKRYLDSLGYRADGVRASLADLVQVGIPAIVLIRENGYSHFVVVKGVRGGRVLVGDPSSGLKAYAQDEFQALWSNGILFVIRDDADTARRHFNLASEWRARPRASADFAVARDGLSNVTLLRPGRLDF